MEVLMLPFVDKSIIVFLSGMILAFLESSGYASPSNHTENAQNLQTVVGGLIGAITIISFYIHHTVVENNKTNTGPTIPTTSLFTKISQFIFSSKSATPAPEAPALETLQQQQ